MPTDFSILSSNCPAAPTKGRPILSSSRPGASPISMISAAGLPSAKTRLLAVFFKAQPSNASRAARRLDRLCSLDNELAIWVLTAAGLTIGGLATGSASIAGGGSTPADGTGGHTTSAAYSPVALSLSAQSTPISICHLRAKSRSSLAV